MGALSWIAAVAVGASFYAASAVFLPTAVSLFVALLLEPAAAALERRGAGRKAASLCAVALFLLLVFAAAWGCYRSFAGLAAQLPQYAQKLRSSLDAVERRAERLRTQTRQVIPPETQSAGVPKVQVVPGQGQYERLLRASLGSVAEAAGLAVFVPFLSLFLLMEKPDLKRRFDAVAGAWCDTEYLDRHVPAMVRAYFAGNLLLGLCLAAAQWAVFAAMGLDNAFGVGLVSGLLNVVPILGLPFALALPLAQALLQFSSPMPFVEIAAAVIGFHLISSNYVIPRLIAARVNVNGFSATFAMLFWWWMWGAVGFLIAIPLMALLKIALESNPKTAPWAALLCERPPERRG